MPKHDTIGNVHFSEYSVAELADLRDEQVPECNQRRVYMTEPASHTRRFMGGIQTWREAKSILDDGWKVGAKRALTLKDQLEAASAMPKVRRKRRKAAWGRKGRLNVDRALKGAWDVAYRSHKRETVAGIAKCITLTVGWGGNAHRKADELFWSGATVLTLCELLTVAGYSVKVNAVSKTRSNAHRSKMVLKRIVVKDHGEALRPDALAGVLCHAGIYRSYGFLASCHAPWDIGTGLGRNVDWAEAQRVMAGMPDWYETNEVIVRDCYSREAAIRECKEVLARFRAV